MIDLNELEKMVDDTLANETKESLNSWLSEQILCDIKNYISDSDLINNSEPSKNMYHPENHKSSSKFCNYKNAA
ncbi:MAG: hypothetical protein LKF48_09220 [Prevotella sp.]|jgi:hypothetical protein|nr:hypothetical protein [Prevotella sp.]MCH4183321.1 hypothetical protein [Prevotella sp.]MCH4242109.1 hypothetical protein [Prevotella sp.]